MNELDGAIVNFLSNNMTVYFNMLCTLVKNKIFGDVNGSVVVAKENGRLFVMNAEVLENSE